MYVGTSRPINSYCLFISRRKRGKKTPNPFVCFLLSCFLFLPHSLPRSFLLSFLAFFFWGVSPPSTMLYFPERKSKSSIFFFFHSPSSLPLPLPLSSFSSSLSLVPLSPPLLQRGILLRLLDCKIRLRDCEKLRERKVFHTPFFLFCWEPRPLSSLPTLVPISFRGR